MKPEKFWDFLAKNYDQGEGDPSEREDLEIIQKYLNPDDTVLEYACGTGTLAIHIAGWVKEIHAIDISGKMVAAAERKAAERKVTNIHFARTTIFEASYPKESFNVVMAFNILHLLEDAQAAVEKINELLKPGGVFISSTACAGEKTTVSGSVLVSVLQAASKIGIIPPVRILKAGELENVLAQGNFQIVGTKKFVEGIPGISSYFIVSRKIDSR